MVAARLILVLALGVVSAPVHSSPFAGLWATGDGDAHVRVETCPSVGSALCGRIVWLAEPEDEHGTRRHDIHNPDEALNDRPILGLEILRINAVPDGKGVYRNGTIYDPKSGKTYRCKAIFDGPDSLRLRGFVGISLFGRTTYWSRVE